MEKAKHDDLLKALHYLIGFEAGYVAIYLKARALVPESVWQMYKNLETKGTYEQGQLATTRRVMWDEWKNRPNLLRKHNVQEQDKRSNNQGKAHGSASKGHKVRG